MSYPKLITIKESEKEIKSLLTKTSPILAQRLRVLLILKQHELTGISKRNAATLAGVSANSIQKWRTIYLIDGIIGLMKHNKIGFKPSVFSLDERAKLEAKLNEPKNGLQGYVELKEMIRKEFGKEILYRTIVNYCVTNFHSSVKAARKSHIKKVETKVEDFKKTSHKSVKKYGTQKNINSNP